MGELFRRLTEDQRKAKADANARATAERAESVRRAAAEREAKIRTDNNAVTRRAQQDALLRDFNVEEQMKDVSALKGVFHKKVRRVTKRVQETHSGDTFSYGEWTKGDPFTTDESVNGYVITNGDEEIFVGFKEDTDSTGDPKLLVHRTHDGRSVDGYSMPVSKLNTLPAESIIIDALRGIVNRRN